MEETSLTFARPWLLAVAAALPPLLLAGHALASRAARRRLEGVVAPRLREQLLRSVSPARRWWKALAAAAALALLAVALARPQWGYQKVTVERTSADFFIALDLSRSMLAEDIRAEASGPPRSRLEAARTALTGFLDSSGSSRAGLIIFAGDAFLVSPLTEDHEALKQALAVLTPQAITRQGSDPAQAIRLALTHFAAGKKEDGKALVLLTDGEELQGEAVVAARGAAQAGVALFTVGVGTAAGARIPETGEGNRGFVKNESGREVVTRLNERMLRQLAAAGTRGFYEPLGPAGEGLAAVRERGLDPLARSTSTRLSRDPEEYFQWPLALAALLLAAGMLLSDRRRPVRTVPASPRPTPSRLT